jgi:ketosteroid isomerase-like protein
MADKQNISDDEVAVRDLIEAWADSVRRKDYDGILRSHAADFVMFDVPLRSRALGSTLTGRAGISFSPGRAARFVLTFKRWT